MDLPTMRNRVRRDLHDEDSGSYRWTDNELDRHIERTLREFSQSCPREMKADIVTTDGSREIDISGLEDRVLVQAIEFPIGNFPPSYQRFLLYQDTVTLLGSQLGDGSDARIFYGKLHTLDSSSSTIPSKYEEIVAAGAEAYALLQFAAYSINRVNISGDASPRDFRLQGEQLLRQYKNELKKIKSRLRSAHLFKLVGAVSKLIV